MFMKINHAMLCRKIVQISSVISKSCTLALEGKVFECCNLELILAQINPLNAELNPMCHLLALLGVHHIFHVSGLRVNNP